MINIINTVNRLKEQAKTFSNEWKQHIESQISVVAVITDEQKINNKFCKVKDISIEYLTELNDKIIQENKILKQRINDLEKK